MLKDHLLSELSTLNLNLARLNLARLKCLTLLLAGMLRHHTVNLTILATENLTGAKMKAAIEYFRIYFFIPRSSLTF